MVDSTKENICVSRSCNSVLEAIIFDRMVQVIKYTIISFFMIIFRGRYSYCFSRPYLYADDFFRTRFATGTSDWPFDVIHLKKVSWNFTLLSDDDQNLSISTGNCCLIVEILVSIDSNLHLRFLSPCLILCWGYRSKTMSMHVEPFDKDENVFQSAPSKSYNIPNSSWYLPSINHEMNNNRCFQTSFRDIGRTWFFKKSL